MPTTVVQLVQRDVAALWKAAVFAARTEHEAALAAARVAHLLTQEVTRLTQQVEQLKADAAETARALAEGVSVGLREALTHLTPRRRRAAPLRVDKLPVGRWHGRRPARRREDRSCRSIIAAVSCAQAAAPPAPGDVSPGRVAALLASTVKLPPGPPYGLHSGRSNGTGSAIRNDPDT